MFAFPFDKCFSFDLCFCPVLILYLLTLQSPNKWYNFFCYYVSAFSACCDIRLAQLFVCLLAYFFACWHCMCICVLDLFFAVILCIGSCIFLLICSHFAFSFFCRCLPVQLGRVWRLLTVAIRFFLRFGLVMTIILCSTMRFVLLPLFNPFFFARFVFAFFAM